MGQFVSIERRMFQMVVLALYLTMSLMSAVLYLMRPTGAAVQFGDTPNNGGTLRDDWIRIAAAGDMLVAYLCGECLRAMTDRSINDRRIVAMTFRSLFVYALFHVGGFIAMAKNHNVGVDNENKHSLVPFMISLGVASAQLWYWGFDS